MLQLNATFVHINSVPVKNISQGLVRDEPVSIATV